MIENDEIDIPQDLRNAPNFKRVQRYYTDVLTDEEKELIDLELEKMFTPEELQEIQEKLKWLFRNYNERTIPTIIKTYNELSNENNSYLDPKSYKNATESSTRSQQTLERKALNFFQTELNNIKLAISYAQEEQQWERVIEISGSLPRFLNIRTYWEDLEEIQKDALSAAQQGGQRLIEARLLYQSAEVQRLLGNAKDGIDKCDESRRIFQSLNDEYGEAKALYTLGYLNRSLGNWDKSAEAFEGALKLLRNTEKNQNVDVQEDIAEALDGLGQIYTRQERLESAKEVLLQSLNLKEKLNNRFSISKTTNNLGKVYIELYNSQNQLEFLQKAKMLFENSLRIKCELDDRQGQGVSFNELGKVHRLMGNYNKALEYYKESLKVKKQVSATGGGVSDKHGEGLTYMEMGFLYEDWGEQKTAQKYFRLTLQYLNFYSPQFKEISQRIQDK